MPDPVLFSLSGKNVGNLNLKDRVKLENLQSRFQKAQAPLLSQNKTLSQEEVFELSPEYYNTLSELEKVYNQYGAKFPQLQSPKEMRGKSNNPYGVFGPRHQAFNMNFVAPPIVNPTNPVASGESPTTDIELNTKAVDRGSKIWNSRTGTYESTLDDRQQNERVVTPGTPPPFIDPFTDSVSSGLAVPDSSNVMGFSKELKPLKRAHGGFTPPPEEVDFIRNQGNPSYLNSLNTKPEIGTSVKSNYTSNNPYNLYNELRSEGDNVAINNTFQNPAGFKTTPSRNAAGEVIGSNTQQTYNQGTHNFNISPNPFYGPKANVEEVATSNKFNMGGFNFLGDLVKGGIKGVQNSDGEGGGMRTFMNSVLPGDNLMGKDSKANDGYDKNASDADNVNNYEQNKVNNPELFNEDGSKKVVPATTGGDAFKAFGQEFLGGMGGGGDMFGGATSGGLGNFDTSGIDGGMSQGTPIESGGGQGNGFMDIFSQGQGNTGNNTGNNGTGNFLNQAGFDANNSGGFLSKLGAFTKDTDMGSQIQQFIQNNPEGLKQFMNDPGVQNFQNSGFGQKLFQGGANFLGGMGMAYGGPRRMAMAYGGPEGEEDKKRDFILGLKKSKLAKNWKGDDVAENPYVNLNTFIGLQSLGEFGFDPEKDAQITSTKRTKKGNVAVKGDPNSDHLMAAKTDSTGAVDLRIGDPVVDFYDTDAGKKWAKANNVFYKDETNREGYAPHHHFSFRGGDPKSVKNYKQYKKIFDTHKDKETGLLDLRNMYSTWNDVDIEEYYPEKVSANEVKEIENDTPERTIVNPYANLNAAVDTVSNMYGHGGHRRYDNGGPTDPPFTKEEFKTGMGSADMSLGVKPLNRSEQYQYYTGKPYKGDRTSFDKGMTALATTGIGAGIGAGKVALNYQNKYMPEYQQQYDSYIANRNAMGSSWADPNKQLSFDEYLDFHESSQGNFGKEKTRDIGIGALMGSVPGFLTNFAVNKGLDKLRTKKNNKQKENLKSAKALGELTDEEILEFRNKKNGGYTQYGMGGDTENTVTYKGPTHEGGGIPLGYDYGGKVNQNKIEVEGEEVKWKDPEGNEYIFSNRLGLNTKKSKK